MKCFYLLASFCLYFLSTPLFSQNKSVTGYYITSTGDTIRGVFPTYAQKNRNPSQVEFLPGGATSPISLTPQNTRKFIVEGYDEYISYTGNRLLNPIENVMLINETSPVGTKDSIQQKSTFLRLVTGTTGAELYVLEDASRKNFFYILPGQQLTELRFKKRRVQDRIIETAEYRQQLNNIFTEAIIAKNLTSTLERLSYTENALSSFFQKLFPANMANRKKQNNKAQWVVSAGVILNTISVKTEAGYNSIPQDYASSYSPLASVGLIVPLNRNFGKYFLSPQASMFRYKNAGEQNHDTYISSVTYQSNFVLLTKIAGGYNLVNKENRRIYIAAGIGAISQFNATQLKIRYNATDRSYIDTDEEKLPTVSYTFDASFGAELSRKFVISTTYMIPTRISNFVTYSPKLSGVQLSVGYKL